MKKVKIYKYIGRNGTITSPILLDGIVKIDMYHLTADEGKVLTNGDVKLHSIHVYVDEVDNWIEIDDKGQN